MRCYFLLIAVSFVSIHVIAQSAKNDSLYHAACSLYQSGEYRQAIPLFEQVVELDKAENPDDLELIGTSSHWLASCHYRLGDIAGARKAEPLYFELEPVDRALTVKSREYTRLFNSASNIDNAIYWAQRCVEEEIKNLGEDHFYVYGSWCTLAQFAFMKGDETMCREYIAKAEELLPRIPVTSAGVLRSMISSVNADLEFNVGDKERAEEIARETWNGVRGNLEIAGMSYLRTMKILLAMCMSRFETDEANRLAGIAADEYMSINEDNVGEYYLLVSTLAEYYVSTSQPSRGIGLCDYAVKHAQAGTEPMADLLFHRGQLHMQAKNIDLAINDYKATIEICRELYPGNEEFLAQYYFALGDCYVANRKYDKSEEAFKTALKGFRKQGEAGISGRVLVLHHLGVLATRTLDYKKAIEYIDESLGMINKEDVGSVNDLAYLHKERGACEERMGEKTKAMSDYREAIRIYEQNDLPLTDDTYFEASINLCGLLLAADDDSREAKAIMDRLEELFAEDNLYNRRMKIKLWYFQSSALSARGRHNEAIALLDRCIDLAKDDESYDMTSIYESKVMGLATVGRRDEALALFQDYAELTEARYGKMSREYVSSLMMGGAVVNFVGGLPDISKMNEVGDEIVSVAREVYAPNEQDCLMALSIAGKMKALTHPNEAADLLLELVRRMADSRMEYDTQVPALIYSTLSDISRNGGDYAKAIEYGEKCVEYADKNISVGTKAGALYALGQAYLAAGQLSKAEDMLNRALGYAMESNGGANLDAYGIYQSLMMLYAKMGRPALVAKYQEKANALYESHYSDYDLMGFVSAYNNLWSKYGQGLKDECLADIDRIEEDVKSVVGDAPNLDGSLPSRLRATYWMYENNLELAESYADLALLMSRNVDNLLLRAQISLNKDELPESETLTKEALDIVESYFGKESYEAVPSNKMLGDIYLREGDPVMATRHYRRCFDNGTRYIYDNLLTLTSDQRADFWKSNYGFFRIYLPSLCRNFEVNADMSGLLYDAMLFSNGLLLNVDKSILRTIQASGDDIKGLYAELNGKKDILIRAAEQGGDTDALNADVNRIEKELMRRLRDKGGDDDRWSVSTWQQVRKALPKDAAAVEFIDFPVDSASHAGMAVVLTRDMKYPQVKMLYTRMNDDNLQWPQLYDETAVGDLVWGGLSDMVGGCKDIYFTPQGPLCSIAVESLPVSDGKLQEGVKFHRLSSTAELIYAKKKRKRDKGATLYGGLNYDTSVDELRADAEQYPELRQRGFVADNLLFTRMAREGTVEIPYLKGSRMEVDSIAGFMTRVTRRTPVYKKWNEGTETSFKALSGRYGKVLHVSTHGFFITSDDISAVGALTIEDQALQRSGLLMSGAANKYVGSEEFPEDIDDGILTAAEIADLDLSGVDIAVLSACETGLGEVTGDGVFGLQRGFKKAGAGSILMSLWKVDDDATCRLMTEFYRHWLGDPVAGIAPSDKHTALEAAKAEVRANPDWSDPSYWAAFILLDALD